MTQSTWYRGTNKMTPVGVLWHSTGANNPTLKRYVQPDDNASNKAELLKKIGTNAYHNDWNHIQRYAGLNAWIGQLANGTVTTIQTGPWNYAPWGCGSGKYGSCNNGWIQFEICEDGLNNKAYFDKVYKEACELTAYLCQLYNIDPNGTVIRNGVKIPTILCHQDSYQYGFGGNHSDVYHWFKRYGKTMQNVRNDVASLLNTKPSTPSTTPTTPTTTLPGYTGIITYQSYANGRWWGEIKSTTGTGSNSYSGLFGYPISGLRAKAEYGKIYVQSHLKGGGWLGKCSKYVKDGGVGTGYSGMMGRPIDAIKVWSETGHVDFRVHLKGGGWLDWIDSRNCDGSGYNSYAGIFGREIDGIQMK